QDALHEHRERHAREAGARGERRDRLHAGLASDPRTSVTTTSEMPMSMVMPVSVRSHQYERMALTESIQSACAISMKPCCSPWAVSTSVIAPMPRTMSQKPALATRKLGDDASSGDAAAGLTRGHTYTAPAIAHITNVPKTVRCE